MEVIQYMTDKELRKLRRTDLLEMLFYMQKEMETLRQENENLRKQLADAAAGRMAQADLEQLTEAVKQAVQEAMKTAKPSGKAGAKS